MSKTYSENETPNVSVTLTDAATDQYPRAFVYNYDKTLKETIDLTHNGNGEYIGTAASAYTHNSYTVVYKVFSDAGRTTLNSAYWVVEEDLYITYQPTWGNSGGGSGNIFIDVKKIAEEVWSSASIKKMTEAIWDHAMPKNMLKLLEFIKEVVVNIRGVVPKITDARVIQAIKGIVFPKIPAFPTIPKPEKVDLSPISNTLKEVISKIKDLESSIFETDYGSTLSKLVETLEGVDSKVLEVDYGNTLSQLVDMLECDKMSKEKAHTEHMDKLEELKKLIKKL